MTSRLAQQVAQEGIFGGKARQFYLEVCRCVPFIHRAMRLDELVSVREIRAIIKEQFLKFKDVKDPRVIDMLIFKGREELEVYLTLHKQRHHAISEYLDPILSKKQSFPKAPSNNSAFLDSFLKSNYIAPTAK
jgi:NADH dehydrogenase (ubiquinone) 1 alpha subcomplex subunit 6